MYGFIIFAVIVLFVVFYNTPVSEIANTTTCKIPTKYTSSNKPQALPQNKDKFSVLDNANIDTITKKNTNINSTTAITTTNKGYVLKGDATDIIDPKILRKKSSKSKTSKKPKLKFSNNVNVRLFDKKTRDIINDGKQRL